MTTNSNKKTKKEEIIDIASDLFYEQGYHCTGVQQIIQTSGIAKGTFYSHFKSKEELGVAWLTNKHRKLNEQISTRVKTENDPKKKILALFDFIGEWMTECDFRGCAFINTLSETPDPTSPLREAIIEHKEDLRHSIGKLLENCGSGYSQYRDCIFILFEGAIVESQNFRDIWPILTAKKHVEELLN